jgi:hypothetical protein
MKNIIKRGSTVTNTVSINGTNGCQPINIPAGSTLLVYKISRKTGYVYCQTEQYRFASIVTTKENLTVVPQTNPVKVNDIFYSSWGYDQTNIDFYQVIDVLPNSVKVVKIGEDRTYTGPMQGNCVPNLNHRSDKILTKRIKVYNNNVSFKIASYASAYPWTGQPMNFTEWA